MFLITINMILGIWYRKE